MAVQLLLFFLWGWHMWLTVSGAQVKLHNKEDDCWIILKGRVYNITTYLNYHPGGKPKLMAVAGKDATTLFDKFHQWVNYDFLLSTSLIGIHIGPGIPQHFPSLNKLSPSSAGSSSPKPQSENDSSSSQTPSGEPTPHPNDEQTN
jgi:cytochrome b involved in lipid metabolism